MSKYSLFKKTNKAVSIYYLDEMFGFDQENGNSHVDK